jgi:hypothetical protein
MSDSDEYNVILGTVARTILYRDAIGTLTFTFDVDSVNGQNIVILDPHSKSLIECEQVRINLAFERIKKYLISRGYKVELFGQK